MTGTAPRAAVAETFRSRRHVACPARLQLAAARRLPPPEPAASRADEHCQPGDGRPGRRYRLRVPGPGDHGDDLAGDGRSADAAGPSKTYHWLPMDVFDGQPIPQGSWMVPNEAGCAV